MRGQRVLTLFLWCLSAGTGLAGDESATEAPSLKVEQPKSSDRRELLLHQEKSLRFDPYSDDRRSADDLYGQWPADDRSRLSPSVPTNAELGDLMKLGRRQDDLYQEWLDLRTAEDLDWARVEAAERDFISPGSYDLLGMKCDFTVCKIPDTGCVIALFPPLGACSF